MPSPSVTPPSGPELEKILADNAHRYPEQGTITVPGEDGGDVVLRVLLGVPTGSLPAPEEGQQPRPRSFAWSRSIAEAMLGGPEAEANDAALVRDCVLWPPPPQFAAWRDYWPGVDAPALRLVKAKLGLGPLFRPEANYPLPAGFKPPSARGSRLILRPAPQVEQLVAIEPPAADAWRMYLRLVRDPKEDVARRTRELVDSCGGDAFAATLDRWPGLVLRIAQHIAHLAGAGAEAQLGNW